MNKQSQWVSRHTTSDKRDEALPTVGKIHRRLASNQRQAGAVRRRRRKGRSVFIKKDYQHDMVVRWSMAIGSLTVAALVGVFGFWLNNQKNAPDSTSSRSSKRLNLGRASSSPSGDQAVEIVKSAVAVVNPERVSDFFHLGSSTPQEVVDYLKAHRHEDTSYFWAGSMEANGLEMEGVSVSYNVDGKSVGHMALLHADASQIWKIDFPAYARLCVPTWKEIENRHIENARVRVVVIRDNYFNGPFNDREWYCFRLLSPELERWHYAYCRMDSVQAKAMRWIFSRDPRLGSAELSMQDPGRRAILDIKRMEGAQDNQFEITRVVAEDWVLQDQIFEDRLADK